MTLNEYEKWIKQFPTVAFQPLYEQQGGIRFPCFSTIKFIHFILGSSVAVAFGYAAVL